MKEHWEIAWHLASMSHENSTFENETIPYGGNIVLNLPVWPVWGCPIYIWRDEGSREFCTHPAEVRFTVDGGQPLFALGSPMFALSLDDFLSLREGPGTNIHIYIAPKKFMNSFGCHGYGPCLFQQVTVRKPLYINQPNKFCFSGHILYCSCQKMITIGFTRTMYACLLKKPIELYQSTTYFPVFLISLQI